MAEAEVAVKAGTASDAEPTPAPTTTISTISLQSGGTRLVIALLQSGDWLQLKLLEATPELTKLGADLQEAEELQRAHNEVLKQLQSKQSPVEELLRQADQVISNQKPRAEVYAAMAQSLGLAWADVNSHLELRRQLLDLNVSYHRHASSCVEAMRVLEVSCGDSTGLPTDADSAKEALSALHEARRVSLEALVPALQDGRELLERLRQLVAQGSEDSRPNAIRVAASFATSQVEHWLEALHDRRQLLDVLFSRRKERLEQCLALMLLAQDLRSLEAAVERRQAELTDVLGDSAASAEILLSEHHHLLPEAKDFQEQGLRITKATEKLVSSEHFAAEEAVAQAYKVLQQCADYCEALEHRDLLLQNSIDFFNVAQSALHSLDELAQQLKTSNLPITSPQLSKLHAAAAQAIEDITEEPLKKGYALLEAAGHAMPGAEGIKRKVEELENQKIELSGLCIAHKEEHLRVSRAMQTYTDKQEEIFEWIVQIAEAFLQGHQDMGSVLAMAQDFLQLHQQLFADVQGKGAEINNLLLTLPPILEVASDEERTKIDDKVETLHNLWLKLKNLVEARIYLAQIYVKFHSVAVDLANEFDALDEDLKKNIDKISDETIRNVEQKWLYIQQLYTQLQTIGKSVKEEASKIGDPYLDTKRATLCVDTLLEHFGGRQLTLTQSWEAWQSSVTVERETLILWEKNMADSSKTYDWASKLDAQLYPVMKTDSSSSKIIVRELEDKVQSVLPELKKAQTEIELRVKAAENIAVKGDSQGQKETVTTKLMSLHSKLQSLATDYQILLQMLISFFKNLAELEKTIENLESQYRHTRLPNSVSDIELLLKEHEASRQAVLELFKFTQNEREQIVTRIKQQEPEMAAKHDIDSLTRLLEIKQIAWESAWTDRKLQIEQHRQLCQFDSDLQQINATLSDLSNQLAAIKGQYGESLASAKATSLAFVYFEKTIELLEVRIQTFVSTAENMLSTEHVSSPHVENELKQLQSRWEKFHDQVVQSRHLIDLSIEYFTLVEEAEEWFREGSKLLVTIARKSTTVKQPEEASQLLTEVETFLKPGEIRQDERIKKISFLAVQLYGEERSKQVTLVLNENREMIDSFTVISEELSTLARNLKAAEEEREKQKKEQQVVEASLAAARAEAAAAQAAAAAAEEARRAAEVAAKVLKETSVKVHKVDVEMQVAMPEIKQHERPEKSPSPPIKKAKIVSAQPKATAPVFSLPLNDAIIQEGEKFTFHCCVTGSPTPEVVWYKDGISIQNNPDYQTSFKDGTCSLTIEETFAEDSAKFTCRATNSAGTAETTAKLSVKESEPEEQMCPPNFTQVLQDITAREGSSHELHCHVEGVPLPTVQWFKNGVCVDSSPDYVITFNNGEAVLRFEEVFLEDQAEYSCRATNPLGSDSCTARLTVEPLEPTETPAFIVPLSNVMARAGQKIKLECEVSGLPLPQVTWTHNNKAIKETRDLKVQYEDKKATLLIAEAFPKDAGVYVVSAKNIAGEATSSCNVSVKGRLPTETSDSELASDMEPTKPSIQVPLKDIVIFEGKKARLDCVIVGQPEPEVIWYHDERPVKESSDFQLLFQGDRCSLVIEEAYMEDSGEYKVVAINSAGEASSKCSLTVKSLGDSEPAIRPQVSQPVEETTGKAPKFDRLLTDVMATECEPAVLECCVVGEPQPEIKWLHNNIEIKPNPQRKIEHHKNGIVSLTITSATPDDKGVYTVKASNSHGEAKCFSNLIVKSTGVTDVKNKIDRHVFPAFKELFADRTVYTEDSTKFECIVTGKPTPKVKWYFDDEPVSGKDFLVSTSGERQVLTIPRVMKSHAGKISCVAENEVGKATCLALLTVEDPPDLTMLPSFETSNVAEQLESSSFSMKRSVFMKSSTSQVTSSTILSTGGEQKVESHSYSSESQQSLQQSNSKPPTQVESHKTVEVHEVHGKPEIQQSTFLKVSSAGEESQESSTSSYSTPVASPKPIRKSVGPRFVSPLNGKIVDQGADVILEGIIDGYPQPDVNWTKNGQPLLPKEDSVIITWEFNKARVELRNVGVRDAGRYTCTATNKAGSASSTADVVVKKTIFPPVFGRRLQAQAVKLGERVVMEVEVTGTPEPEISWFKDGEQINTGEKYRLKSQGNCHSLIIEKATPDYTGKYTVKAKNSGGEAQCIADFVVCEPEPTTDTVQKIIFEDLIESKTQKQSHLQTSATKVISEVASPAVASKIQTDVTSPASFFPKCFTSESLTVTEQTKSEKHVSIKVDHVPSPDVQNTAHLLSVDHTLPKEIQIPVTIEKRKLDETSKEFSREHKIPIQLEEQLILKSQATQEKDLKTETIIDNRQFPLPEKHTEYQEKSASFETIESDKIKENKIVEDLKDTEHSHSEPQETGIDSVSISKQSAFDFFVSRLKEAENEPASSKVVTREEELPVKGTVKHTVKTFSDIQKKDENRPDFSSQIKTEQKLKLDDIKTKESPAIPHNTFTTSHLQTEKVISTTTTTSQQLSQLSMDEFSLLPEPPPEICFIPKSETSKRFREDVTTRVKKLEEGHRVLSPVEVPSGGVKIFPTPTKSDDSRKEELKEKTSSTVSAPVSSVHEKTDSQKAIIRKEVQEEICIQKKVSLPGTVDSAQPVIKPKPKQEGAPTTKPLVSITPWSPPKTQESSHQQKPVSTTPWSQPKTEEQKPVISLPSSHSITSASETSTTRIISSEHSELSLSCVDDHVSYVPRPTSPRPSAEGIAMEKLWTPHKPPEPEAVIMRPPSATSRSYERDSSPKPSVEGLAMDKLWAHKHPDSALQKVWPPPQPAEEKPIIPWVSKATTEKMWPPSPSDNFSQKMETSEDRVEYKEQEILQPVVKKIQTDIETNKEIKTIDESDSFVNQFQPIKPLDQNVTHYVAETKVLHSSATAQSESQVTEIQKTESISEQYTSISSNKVQKISQEKEASPPVVEEKILKPSEVKKTWPPGFKEDFEMKAPPKPKPPVVRDLTPRCVSVPVPEIPNEPFLEPGPPPEIGFAHPPPPERRQSYVESIEQDLEKDLDKEPSRHLVGAVRTIPPPPQKEKKSIAPVLRPKEKVVLPPDIPKEPKLNVNVLNKQFSDSKPFERFPDLEPFPFKPDTTKQRSQKLPPPPKPSKFVKGDFGGSDYESDLESTHIPSKWRPYESDSEELGYRRVRPPLVTQQPKRPKSTEPEPLPPSLFDKPPQFDGPPRPDIKITKEVKSDVLRKSVSGLETKIEQTKKIQAVETKKKISPPPLKPGSPPIFVQSVPTPKPQDIKPNIEAKKSDQKPDSPKSKSKPIRNDFRESGYMADTDEPRTLSQSSHKSTTIKHEESCKTTIEQTTLITEKHTQSSQSMMQQQKILTERPTQIKHHTSLKGHHRHSEHKAEKKVLASDSLSKQDKEFTSTVIMKDVHNTSGQVLKDERDSSLEPFPFKVEQPRTTPKRISKVVPAPSPSKFVKKEFRESDYESDYEGRIPPKWKPVDSDAEEPMYRSVRPVLTPRLSSRASTDARTPTPPTEFDNPPDISGPPRPKFEPIDKPKHSVKLDKSSKPVEIPQAVFKPKPVTPKAFPPIDVIVATPATKPIETIILEPGPPPEMGYIPPPKTGHKVKQSPFHNATQTETSNVMNFAEETETSRRIVSLQQTTRIIKFGDEEKSSGHRVESFPFKQVPERTRRSSAPAPPTPTKFVRGELRESDYESDYEGRIKPKWTPANSDNDEPKYRKVKPPQFTRSASVPSKASGRIPPPTEYDTQPPYISSPSQSSITTVQRETKTDKQTMQYEAEQKRLRRVEEMKKRFSEPPSPATTMKKDRSLLDLGLRPGEPPQYGFVSTTTASSLASKHMSEMTSTFRSKAQSFVDEIITDVSGRQENKPDKSILKPTSTAATNGEKEPQAYREESRLSQYGTKQIDPDTGLIYFKYDFGYEFGVVLPGEGSGKGSGTKSKIKAEGKQPGDIDFPVIHETTKKEQSGSTQSSTVSQLRPRKVNTSKVVKWEPGASESEMSEAEYDSGPQRRQLLSQSSALPVHIQIPAGGSGSTIGTPSPVSLSPSLPSLSPHLPGDMSSVSPGSSWASKGPRGRGTTPTPPSTPGSTPTPTPPHQLRRPPIFITPLRDIAVVSGQTARFECIVQAEPAPNILWSKNGRIIENSSDYQIHYRNGVCRLTIPQAYPEDAGSYTCTATNMLGSNATTSTLQVPGERRGIRT